MRILVAVTDDVFDTGLSSLLDTFETANELAGETKLALTVISPSHILINTRSQVAKQ